LNIIRITSLALILSYSSTSQVLGQLMFDNPRHASNYDWTLLQRLQILDESHALGDFFYDRGFSRVITPRIKREYELDMMNQEFNFGDQFDWYQNDTGLRSRFGSYTKTTWAVLTELHTNANLTANSDLYLHTYQQQDARADRALFELEYRQKLSDNYAFSFSHTVAEFKKDVDITASFHAKDQPFGEVTFSYTFQNYLNNIVNEAGNNANPLNPNTRILEKNIESPNLLLMGRWTAPGKQWYNFDLSFIYQPIVRSRNYDRTVDDFSFDERNNLYLINALADVKIRSFVLGAFAYIDYDATNRSSANSAFNGSYKAKQQSVKRGFFAYGKVWKFEPTVRLSFEDYADRQYGDDFSISVIDRAFEYREFRTLLDLGLGYSILDNLRITGRYLSQRRDIEDNSVSAYLTQNWTGEWFINQDFDHRIALHVSTRVFDKLLFEAFGAYDLDADTHRFNSAAKRFDKGGAKLIVLF
jgi:hypothetical protein